MGEIRIFGPHKTRKYPYPVCKKEFSSTAKTEQTPSRRIEKMLYSVSFFFYGCLGWVVFYDLGLSRISASDFLLDIVIYILY